MDVLSLAIVLLSGTGGGLLVGKIMNSNIGTSGRAFTGMVGGIGLAILAPLILGLNLNSILGGVIYGGVGGTILSFILGTTMRKR